MYLLWNCTQVNIIVPYWWQVNVDSGNDLVPSDSKPLSEQMSTQIYVDNWCH